MKKFWFAILLLAVILSISAKEPAKLIRLTVINKSGLELEIELTGSMYDCYEEYHYYLHVPEGTKLFPSETVFTILPDKYSMSVYYLELWDPVYGYDCSSQSLTINATRNVRVLVPECTWTPPNSGEPSMVKVGGAGRSRRR